MLRICRSGDFGKGDRQSVSLVPVVPVVTTSRHPAGSASPVQCLVICNEYAWWTPHASSLSKFIYVELGRFCIERVGFKDTSHSKFDRVFTHSQHGTLLAFSMLDDAATARPVRDADITSVEFHLQQDGLLTGKLADLPARVGEP
jgi:hypothetical protein